MSIINTENLKKIIESNKPVLDYQLKRQNYYNGEQEILKITDTRRDGQLKQKNVNNFTKYVVDAHSAFSLSNPVTYLSTEPINPGLDAYNNIYDESNLDINDLENFESCLIAGTAIEVVSLIDGVPTVTNFNPQEWIIVEDASSVMLAAIHTNVLPANSFYLGTFIEKEIIIYTVYDETDKIVYVKRGGEFYLESAQPHYFGEVPVVVYSINKDKQSLITNALINQQDVMNKLMNEGEDDFLLDVNSLLALTGYTAESLTEVERDEQGNALGYSAVQELATYGIINLDENGKAEFINRGNFNDKLQYLIEKVREQIHIESSTVDVNEIVGATGVSSGIALKLKYQPMKNVALAFTSYFKKGLKKRIDLINKLLSKGAPEKPIIDFYEVSFTYNIPVNDIELIQNIDKMATIMDQETILSQLSFIKNPEKVIERKKEEGVNDANSELISNNEPEIVSNNKQEIEFVIKTE